MKIATIPVFYIFLIVISCNSNSNSSIDTALSLAGKNSNELEKVLEHYRLNPSDSLKYKAALFLIESMPSHSYKTPINRYNSVFDSVARFSKWTRRDTLEKLLKSGFLGESETNLVVDIQTIKAKHLIQNIDLAFMAWSKIPINNRASFDEFCNYILPYRNDEPFEANSRKKLFDQYSWVYDYLNNGATLKFVIDSITNQFAFVNFPEIGNYYPIPLSINQINKIRLGRCDDGVNYFVSVFRALGIISARDAVTHWGNHHALGHSWIYAKYGSQEYSTDVQGKVDLKSMYETESIPRIYRTTFRHQGKLSNGSFEVDVTETYVPTVNLSIENLFKSKLTTPIICVFDNKSNWYPVSTGQIENKGKLSFKNLGVNVLYLAASLENGTIVPVNFPFFVNPNKKIHFFNPNEKVKVKGILTRKTGLSSPRNTNKLSWISSLNESVFEGSQDSNFQNSTQLYKISNFNSPHINRVALTSTKKFKYVRFNSVKGAKYLATLKFYDHNLQELTGIEINKNLAKIHSTGAFDNNPLTFCGGRDFTLGFKFETKKSIRFIDFQSRNDGNHINVGESYELFYWDKDWKSLGTKSASDTILHYEVPKNALLWLKGLSKGKEEHVFTIGKNSKQIWLGFDNH